MTRLLQDKDEHWRKRPNGATPVFDPGLSPLGTDSEAGGARAPVASTNRSGPVQPLPATPRLPKHDPRLPIWFWWSTAGAIGIALVVFAVVSFA
ncbi:hypothetical protein [Brevundimonas goettingensis]|uniref:Uncharacterized protein n=1 Tax=Brevundimonas goettingensis TaxID=2774190 RepID=A0A975GX84_9CAUL|nr:hypothetical protein [Brevundimonas goettingensis]QTC90265.1 hypothetical protein IFJ75_13380 [Brevundimonas goettingensis]